MSIFDFSNFERQGNIDNDIQLSGAEEIRESVIHLAANALRSVKIFSPDLEQIIYHDDTLRDTLLTFCRGNRHAQIQILAEDLSSAINNGHRLIQLAQQLTSAMLIKNTPEDFLGTNNAFILVDQSSFIYRPDRSSHMAVFSSCKHRANRLNDFFSMAWEQAEIAPQARRILI